MTIIISVRNEVAKVMFLQESVCPWGGLPQCMLGYHPHPPGPEIPPPKSRHTPPPTGAGTPSPSRPPAPGAGTPPPADGYCCGRYASYWNAFLFWKAMRAFVMWSHRCRALSFGSTSECTQRTHSHIVVHVLWFRYCYTERSVTSELRNFFHITKVASIHFVPKLCL